MGRRDRDVRGIVEVPGVNYTYLVRADAIPELTYEEESGRHEYVVFCDSARKAGIPQSLDNRQVYGYISSARTTIIKAAGSSGPARRCTAPATARDTTAPRLQTCPTRVNQRRWHAVSIGYAAKPLHPTSSRYFGSLTPKQSHAVII